MKTWLILTTLTTALAACSGGGSTGCGSSTVPIGGGGASSVSTGCGTTVTTPTAADLIVNVTTTNASGIQNTGADTATVTVTAVDANRNVLGSIPVTIVPDNTAVVTVSGTKTDTNGVVTGTISLGNDRSNRNIAVVVTSGTITKTLNIAVTGAKITATPNPALITAGQAGNIQYRVVDANSSPMAGVAVTVSGSLSSSTGTTDSNGNYTYTFTAPAGTTPLEFDASAAGVTTTTTVAYETATVIPPAVGTVRAASLSANPSTVGINTAGSTVNQVEVRGLFLSDNNTPMANVRVRFDLDGDLNTIGGSLTSGDNIVYTDANGVARTTYIAGSRSSGDRALTIRACYDNNDFPLVSPVGSSCPNGQQATAQVSVVDEAVSVSVNSDNKIIEVIGQQVYQIGFSVQVVDAVGNPKAGVLVKGDLFLPRYSKGQWIPVIGGWVLGTTQSCDNEDINGNKVLNTFSNGQTEDANGDGKLQPAAADAVIAPAAAGSDTTDEFGRAYFLMQFGENKATWVDYQLTFSATVGTSEGSQIIHGTFPAPAALFTQTAGLPFEFSPYGTAIDLSAYTTVTDPSTGKSGHLCTLPPSP